MRQQRIRFKHNATLQERLAEEAARFRQAAEEAAPGMARDLLLGRARQAEAASQINGWLNSPGLQPPK